MNELRIIPIKEIKKLYNGCFTESSIRWLIFNEKINGFSKCIIRIGRKILINLDEFEKWIVSEEASQEKAKDAQKKKLSKYKKPINH